MRGGDDGGQPDRPFLGKPGCLIFLALCAVGNLAALLGAGAYLQYAVEHASRWTDFFSPSFCWEYAQTPLGATLWIVAAATSVLGLALLANWKRQTR